MNKTDKIIDILGGSLIQDNNGRWRTTNFNEGDNFGALGDRLRVLAASYLYQHNSKSYFLASGGKGQLKAIKSAPFISTVVKKELVALGVPTSHIATENNSNTTYEQLLELDKYVKNHKIREVEIISNEHHLPRIKYMIKTSPKLLDLRKLKLLKLLSAEKICLQNEPRKWRSEITKAYKSEAMKIRIKVEQQGINDLKNGKYKFS
ncbi:MAG: YdcF family protein [Patescibacteria group bacterium]|jgi:hypothetical protein